MSASKLSRLANPEACLRCFWLAVKVPEAEDYHIHAGALQKIDQLAKHVVARSFKLHGKAPDWIPLDCDSYMDKISKKYFTRDWGDGMVTSGIPDEVLHMVEGGHAIVDYKSGKFTMDSPWRNVYKAQVQIYAALNKHLNTKIVGILYMQPSGDPIGEELAMDFKPVWDYQAANDEIVFALVDKAKEVLGRPLPASHSSCRQCAALAIRASVVTDNGIEYSVSGD